MNDEMVTVNGAQRVQSVVRAAELLKALGALGEPATVYDLADRCGLNRSTAWRILATLEDEGLVERDPASGRYGVGYALVALGAAAGHDPLVRRAHAPLRALAEACAETASLAVPRRLQLVYVDQVQAPHVMAADWLGRATPLHATSTGKALLAWLSEDEIGVALPGRLERYTDTTITTRAVLRAELADIRARGYAVSRGELEPALWGVSAPVLDGGRAVAVVSVWGTEARVRTRGLDVLGARTVAAADEIAAAVAVPLAPA
jgi:DNA-binding IclR family transcriptional regulator